MIIIFHSWLMMYLIKYISGAIFNADPRYDIWNKLNVQDSLTRIPVYIDSSKYDLSSLSVIQQAIAQMNSDLNGCIQFFQVPAPLSSTRDFVYVSTTNNEGITGTTCSSFPGRLVSQNHQGQKLLLIGGGGPGSCLGSVREAMRLFTIVLGQRNEFRRPDRLITVNNANLDPTVPAIMYAPYDPSKISSFSPRPGFDFNSITMISPSANSIGSPVYSTASGISVGTLPRLSVTDCSALALRYKCGGFCQDPYQQGIAVSSAGQGQGYNYGNNYGGAGGGGVIAVIPGVPATASTVTIPAATTTAASTTTAALPLPDY